MDFQFGDIVELRSGGPDMTVVDSECRGTVTCVWFPRGNTTEDPLHEEVFPEEALKLIEACGDRLGGNDDEDPLGYDDESPGIFDE